MSQGDVLRALESDDRWMDIKEIAKISKSSISSVRMAVTKMFKYGEVLAKDVRSEMGIWKKYWRMK